MRQPVLLLFLAALMISCEEHEMKATSVETEPPVLNANIIQVNDVVGGYYSGLPVHYSETSKNYPLLICMHGAGQYGNGSDQLSEILNEAIPELLEQKLFPASFFVEGVNYSFIILAPQFSRHPTNEHVLSFIHHAKKQYRIDTTRIYLTGFSEGARVACDIAAAFPAQFAALVAIAGVSQSGDVGAKCKSIASNNLPVWVLHNDQDQLIDVNLSRNFVSLINSSHPVIAPKYTEFVPFGLWNHDAWTKATDPAFKDKEMNIYEWMLHYRR